MNDAQLKKLVSAGKPCMVCVDNGLYFRISAQGTPFWVFRYSINGKRRSQQLGRYGKPPEGMSLKVAKDKVAMQRASVRDGVDPLAEKKRPSLVSFKVVNDVANDWLNDCKKRLENPNIPERVYKKDISPSIGELSIDRVTSRDILGIIRSINESGRPSIANDTLTYLKQIFNHAIKLDLIKNNPALAFSVKDAGGLEQSRERVLTLDEIKKLFFVLNENSDRFTRENYLSIAILLVLGVRKGELIAAKWEEFDIRNRFWRIPGERTKTGSEIKIPLPDSIIPWFTELYIRANGSEYLLPARRSSKRRGYISDDTLNHALSKLFGMKVDSQKKALPNILGDAGIKHFVIHDLRRTCRSLLAAIGVPSHIAERCLNHKIKGVEGIYDRHDYFDERKQALSNLAEIITPLVGNPSQEIITLSRALSPLEGY